MATTWFSLPTELRIQVIQYVIAGTYIEVRPRSRQLEPSKPKKTLLGKLFSKQRSRLVPTPTVTEISAISSARGGQALLLVSKSFLAGIDLSSLIFMHGRMVFRTSDSLLRLTKYYPLAYTRLVQQIIMTTKHSPQLETQGLVFNEELGSAIQHDMPRLKSIFIIFDARDAVDIHVPGAIMSSSTMRSASDSIGTDTNYVPIHLRQTIQNAPEKLLCTLNDITKLTAPIASMATLLASIDAQLHIQFMLRLKQALSHHAPGGNWDAKIAAMLKLSDGSLHFNCWNQHFCFEDIEAYYPFWRAVQLAKGNTAVDVELARHRSRRAAHMAERYAARPHHTDCEWADMNNFVNPPSVKNKST